MSLILAAADRIEQESPMSGAPHDGGRAAALREQVSIYRHGQRGILPPEWKRFVDALDPEWADLQRLKKKFGEIP